MSKLKSVMIVDDNESCVEFMTLALQSHGAAEIVSETKPARALDRIRIEKPDLILLDIKMPLVDGFEVLKRLRANGNRVPVIMCSGSVLQSDVDRAYTAGCNGYLEKPSSLDGYRSLAGSVFSYWSCNEIPEA